MAQENVSVSGTFEYIPGTTLTLTLWNQSGTIYIPIDGEQVALTGFEYNKFCPDTKKDSKEKSVTGCTNTADSQVLYYWMQRGYEFNLSVNSSDYYTLGSEEVKEGQVKTKYYVSNSPTLNEGSMSTINSILQQGDLESGDFVAALNYYCGVKNHSDYGTSTSTSWWLGTQTDGTNSLAFKAAGFDSYYSITALYLFENNPGSAPEESGIFFDQNGLTEVGWSVIRENLDYGEVIRVSIPGHAIYLDGYRFNEATQEYEYHLNYGWGTEAEQYTRWYTVSEFANDENGYDQGNQIFQITIDLSPDIKVIVSNDRGDYYGGSFLRGMERINHIQNDKATTFSFADELDGKTISLEESAQFTSRVDLEFRNFNVNWLTSADNGFVSNDAMTFEMLDGSIVINSPAAGAAIKQSAEKLTLDMNSSWIYTGYLRGGSTRIINALEKDNGYIYSQLETDVLASVKGYAVVGGTASDEINLSNNSAIFGIIDLGAGTNTITVEAGSLLYGGFKGSANTVTVNMLINSAQSGPMIVVNNADTASEFFTVTGGVINLEVTAGVAAKDYTLISGYSATDMMDIVVNLSVNGKSYQLDYDNRSAAGYTLVYNGANLLLKSENSIPAIDPVRIFRNDELISGGKVMSDETIGTRTSMYVSRGGVVENTIVSGGGMIDVASGGMARNTTVEKGALIFVRNGAKIREAEIAAGAIVNGFVNYDSAAFFDDKVIMGDVSITGYGGRLYAGQSAGKITNNGQSAYIYGSAGSMITSGGNVTIFGGGVIGGVDAVGGTVDVSSGGRLGGMSAVSGTVVSLASGARATNVMLDGEYHLDSGAVLNGVQTIGGKVYTDGKVNVSGAMFYFDLSNAELTDGVIVDNLNNLSGALMYGVTVNGDLECGTYVLADNADNFNRSLAVGDGSVNYGYVELGGFALTYDGKTYLLKMVDSSLCLSVGLASAPPLTGEQVKVYSSGTLVKTGAVFAGENITGHGGNNSMYVGSGGFVNMTKVSDGGRVAVTSGGSAMVTSVTGGSATVSRGGVMNDTRLGLGGSMMVIGGQANDIVAAAGATVEVYSRGTVSGIDITGNRAELFVSSNGTVCDLNVNSRAKAFVSSAEIIGANVNSGGSMYVSKGAYAENVKVNSGGWLEVDYLGEVSKLTVAAGGSMSLYVGKDNRVSGTNEFGRISVANGVASGFKCTDALVVLSSGCSAVNLAIASGATLRVSSGAAASSTVVGSDGFLNVSRGGQAADTTVYSGATLYVESKAVHRGKLQINDGGLVRIYKGGTLDFSLAGRTVTDDYLVNDISAVYGTPTFTITVLATQNAGTYKLAQGAESFTGTITIGNGNVNYGKAAINGKALTYKGVSYALTENNGDLTLTISGDVASVNDDLDGNGLSDVFLYHKKGGFVGTWLSTGGDDIIKWGDLKNAGKDMKFLGTGNVSGSADGKDVIFQNGEKSVGSWLIENGKVTGYQEIWKTDSETINVLGLGDFNGDGKTDILLRSDFGDVGCYMTDGSNWNYFKSVGDEWKIAAVGDLNGDGRDDMVLAHERGYCGAWLTKENGSVEWSDLSTLKEGVEVLGTGDFNGDGMDDILIRSGRWVGAWLVEDGKVDSVMGLFSNRSEVEQIGDFDGDGIDDLRIRNEFGDIGVLCVKGADSTEWTYFKSVGDEWETKFSALA